MVVLAGVLAFGGLAVAAEMEGKIQTVDTAGKEMVLDDGTKLTWSDDTKISVKGRRAKLEDLEGRREGQGQLRGEGREERPRHHRCDGIAAVRPGVAPHGLPRATVSPCGNPRSLQELSNLLHGNHEVSPGMGTFKENVCVRSFSATDAVR